MTGFNSRLCNFRNPDPEDAMATETLTREELLQAQKDLCKKNKYPHFAPSSGICYDCHQDIVNESWAETLITGCPKCCRSYCD